MPHALSTFGHELILWDPELLPDPTPALFDPAAWPETVGSGRGAARGRELGGQALVLRHYRRGGLPGRLVADRYLYTGRDRSRPVREFHLTARLAALGLPVPRVAAARVVRSGPWYTGDLVTVRLPARPLAELLAAGAGTPELWRAAGACIARFHAAGLDHADLNARNLLVDEAGRLYLIDLDRGRLRPPGPWSGRNLARLRRSLLKLGLFDAAGWAWLEGEASR